MKILAINGSPRRKGNTTILLHELLQEAQKAGALTEEIYAEELNLKYCRGCLRCNLIKRCAIRGDDWNRVSENIRQADALIFATPVYFRHVTASLKKVLDRFRSFVHVQITSDGLQHTPWQQWEKKFILITCMGSPDPGEAKPVVDLFSFIASILGPDNSIESVIGTRLAVPEQVTMTKARLSKLYHKLNISGELVETDYARNRMILTTCRAIGRNLVLGK